MRKIYRLRQRASAVAHTMPWRTVYLFPDELLETVYPTLGRAISFRWDPNTANTGWLARFSAFGETRHKVDTVDVLLCLKEYSWVVPIGFDVHGQAPGLSPNARAVRIESRRAGLDFMQVTAEAVMVPLRANVPAITVALHFDTGADGIEPLCGHCVNMQSHLMGRCTPGLARCSQHVVVPAAERLVHIRRKAKSNAAQ